MKVHYNSHVIKVADVLWKRDHGTVAEALDAAKGGALVLRATQPPEGKRDIDLSSASLDNALKAAGIDLSIPFNLEYVIRDPLPGRKLITALKGKEGFIDKADYNCLQWAGDRSTGTVPTHPHRNSPMFFRDNGMNVDLIDLYKGASVFLILNGPSFSRIDSSRLKQPGIVTFGVNNGAHQFRPDLWTCVDDPTRFMESIWMDPAITKFVPMAHFRKPIWDVAEGKVSRKLVADFPNVVGFRRNEKFDASQWLTEDTVNWGNHGKLGGGRSVMLSALRICHLLGFRKVFLLGCDFRMSAEEKYWFPEDRCKNAIKNNTNSYRIMQGYFRELLPHFEKAQFEVVNCTEGSELGVFHAKPFDEALAEALVDTTASTEGMYVNRYKGNQDNSKRQGKKSPAPRRARAAAKIDASALSKAVLGSIRNSSLHPDPFYHLTFRDFFPEETYARMRNTLPEQSEYQELKHRDAMQEDGSSSRLHLILTPGRLARLPGEVREVWSPVFEALSSKEMQEEIFALHYPALHGRFGSNVKFIKVQPRVSLVRDLAGYRIGVHRDIPKKIVTTQFYLPRNASQKHLGTSFYRKGEEHSGGYAFDRRMEFAENSGYSFPVTSDSYHGVDPLSERDAPRDSLMLVHYLRE